MNQPNHMAGALRTIKPNLHFIALGAAMAATASTFAGGPTQWVGPSTGVWSVAANWSPAVVPDGVAVQIAPPGGAAVALNVSNLVLPSVTIGAGSSVVHPMSQFCTIAALHNDGAWTFNNGSPFLALLLLGADVEFTGSGAVDLGANIQNRIVGSGRTRQLVNSATHTIRGSGMIGTALTLVNHGLVESTNPSGFMNIDLDPGDNRNEALIVARQGCRLRFTDTSLDSVLGEIRAEASGAVELANATIAGGVLTTAESGVVRTQIGTSDLVDLATTGHVRVLSGTELRLNGTIVNDGTMTTAGAPGFAIVRCTPGVALEGSGSLTMGGSFSFDLLLGQGGTILSNGSDHAIRGGGTVGSGGDLAIHNLGVIEATANNPLVLTLHGGVNDNDGEIAARSTSQLRLVGGVYDNLDGEIRATQAATVRLDGPTILGGLLDTDDSGSIVVVGGVPAATIVETTNTGSILVQGPGTLNLIGAIVNEGSISTVGPGQVATIACASDVVLSGNGTLLLNGFTAWNRIVGAGGLRTLTNGPGHTLRGGGAIGANVALDLVNDGTIRADGSTEMRIDTVSAFVNNGLVQVAAPGQLAVDPGGFVNRGQVVVDLGRQLFFNDTYVQESGATNIDGSLFLPGGSTIELEGGALGGRGGVSGGLMNSAGVVDCSIDATDSPQTFGVSGAYVQGPDGAFAVQLASGANDRLAVGGAATLGGALTVDLAPGFVPPIGAEFTILTAASISGAFECLGGSAVSGGAFEVVISPKTVKLVVVGAPHNPADINVDGVVDGVDMGLLLGNWGPNACGGSLCCPADLNHDGQVDAADLGALLAAWS